MSTAQELNLPAMMPAAAFAERVGLSEWTIKRCIKGVHPKLPPLPAKRAGGRLYITGADGAEWISQLDNA